MSVPSSNALAGKVKFGLACALAGGLVFSVIGFKYFGWEFGSTAAMQADTAAQNATVKALVPECVAKAKADPKEQADLTKLKTADSWTAGSTLAGFGWATLPGSPSPNGEVATACAKTILASAKVASQ